LKEAITIKNFGPLVDIRIDEVKPFTLLIGESASGKSTLIKVITLFRYWAKMLNIRSYLKHANIGKSPFKLSFQKCLATNGLDDMVGPDTEVIYSFGPTGVEYRIVFQNRKLSTEFQLIKSEDLTFHKISFMPETRNVIPAWAERGARLAGGYLGFYFHEAYNDFEAATEVIDNLDLSYLNFRFEVIRKQQSRKTFRIQPMGEKGKNFKLKNASSGIQTSVPLVVVARYFSKTFSFQDAFRRSVLSFLFDMDRLKNFQPTVELTEMAKMIHLHVEEPELSLFPDAQCLLLSLLVDQCFISNKADRRLTLMIATHSPYLLNQVNLLLRAGTVGKKVDGASLQGSDVAVYLVKQGTLQSLHSINAVTGEPVINTIDLSETMTRIYDQYQLLKG
jgi:energy-coupling factor transporter ATP-binding protein EcfA2